MKAKILIIDDEELVRESLGEILRLEGYTVEAAESGEVALQRLEEEPFDLLLLDLKMPGIDGVEVMHTVFKNYQDTKVILLTGHGSMESAIEALRSGANDYLLKPVQTRELLQSVAEALSRRAEQQQRRLLLEQLDVSIRRLKDVEGLEAPVSGATPTFNLEGGIQVDLNRREIWKGNKRVTLTPTEGKLMRVLLENRGRVLSHRELVMLVQGYETSDWEAPEVLRPLVSRLRRKLSAFPKGEKWIANVRGTGYVFEGAKDEGGEE